MTATKDTLESYFQRMVDKTIQAVAIFDDELVIILDDGSEVCLWSNRPHDTLTQRHTRGDTRDNSS